MCYGWEEKIKQLLLNCLEEYYGNYSSDYWSSYDHMGFKYVVWICYSLYF